MDDSKPPEVSPDEKLRTQALVLYVHAYTPGQIGDRLGITESKVRRWAKAEQWDRIRDKAKREVAKRVLNTVKRQYAQILNEQFRSIRYMKNRIVNNLNGRDTQGNPSHIIVRTPNGEERQVPVGELSFDSAYDAMNTWVALSKLEKDMLFQLMPSISESLPQVDPTEVRLLEDGDQEPGAAPQPFDPPDRNADRARRRAEGRKRGKAAEKVLDQTGNLLPFEKTK